MLRRWSTWIAVVVFAAAIFAIDRVLGRYHWAEVAGHLYAIPWRTLLLAAALTVGSYLVLSLYDLLGVRNAGGSLPWRTVATASFTAYAVAHNVGFAALSGGSIRYRIYSKAGLSGLQIAQVIAFCTLTLRWVRRCYAASRWHCVRNRPGRCCTLVPVLRAPPAGHSSCWWPRMWPPAQCAASLCVFAVRRCNCRVRACRCCR